MSEQRINGMLWSQNKITGQWSGRSKNLTAWRRIDPQLSRWTVTCENLNIRQHILPGNMVDVPWNMTNWNSMRNAGASGITRLDYKVGSQHVNRKSGVVACIDENTWGSIKLSRANGSTSRIQPHYFADAYVPLLVGKQEQEESPTRKLIKWLQQNSSGVYRPCLEAADRLERMERALLIFSKVDLTESNCASFDVANRRIRSAALAALK